MSDQKLIKNQLIKNMLYNLVAFTVIFTIFGIIIFGTVKTFLYQSSADELTKSKERFTNGQNFGKFNNGRPEKPNKDNINNVVEPEKMEFRENFPNPRIINIHRDEIGNIINQSEIGNFYDNYISQIEFNKNQLDVIKEICIDDKYYYRMITFQTTNESGEINYVQLLINIDSEKQLLDNFFQILSVGIAVTIVLSIIASYILSKKTLKPIIASWEKQTEFVQNASHELRTPLTIIQAKQELLLQEPESKIIDKSEEIRLTLNETKRLAKLTKDLMLLARADSNKIQLRKNSTNIDSFIKEVTTPYIEFAEVQEKIMSLDLNYKDNILIDSSRIHELMVILLDNAIKYTKAGDRIKVKTYEKDGKCIIEVSDTGIGISDEGKKHIFDRFYRDDKARSRETGGTGLGLSIAYFIVNSHGGTINVEDNKPNGSIFRVKLPN